MPQYTLPATDIVIGHCNPCYKRFYVMYFAMSCILQNTFNAYIEINSIDPVEYEFKKYCSILSDQLFEHADIIDCA